MKKFKSTKKANLKSMKELNLTEVKQVSGGYANKAVGSIVVMIDLVG